jgi:hypothetical protein
MPSSVALLVHLTEWKGPGPAAAIAPGLVLREFSGSPVEALYHKLCAEEGIDEGEPFNYGLYAELTPVGVSGNLPDFDDPYSTADRLCNLFAVVQGHSLTLTRVIWSADGFATAKGTRILYVEGAQSSFLHEHIPPLTVAAIDDLRAMWNHTERLWMDERSSGRIIMALTYFGYAWRSPYLDQVCLNLAIVLEILFAPHNQSELTHQIAYSVAHFIGGSRAEREKTYAFVKKFYGLRSTIVHGGKVNGDDLVQIAPKAFERVASLLRRITRSDRLARTFNEPDLRRSLLSDLVFWVDVPNE